MVENRNKLPAAVGVGVTLVCLLVFGPDRFIIPAMAGIALALVALKDKILPGGCAMSAGFTALQIAVIAAVTALLRFLPFLAFPPGRKRRPLSPISVARCHLPSSACW